MTFKNKILQQYAHEIGENYLEYINSGIPAYNAIYMLCDRHGLTRHQVYRYLHHANVPVKIENRPLNDKGKFSKITDKLPIDN